MNDQQDDIINAYGNRSARLEKYNSRRDILDDRQMHQLHVLAKTERTKNKIERKNFLNSIVASLQRMNTAERISYLLGFAKDPPIKLIPVELIPRLYWRIRRNWESISKDDGVN